MISSVQRSRSIVAALLFVCACGPKPAAQPPREAEPATPVPPVAQEPVPEPVVAPEPPPPPPPPPPAQLLRVTVLSAEVDGHMPNGEDWDSKGASALDRAPKPITDYLAQHPELNETADLVGTPIEAEKFDEVAQKSVAADPMVLVEVGDHIFRTPAQPREFNPVWEFPFVVLFRDAGDRQGVAPGTVVHFNVVDYDGASAYDIIGSTLITIDELAAKPVHQLGPFGSVKRLTIQVASSDAPPDGAEPATYRVAVPGNALWTDTGIDLVAGQRVTIEAADEVCSKGGSLSHCSGPEGQRRTSSYNLRGFEKIGHAALVAALGDTRFPVLRGRELIAPSSGRLRLGINDKDVRDNRGSYAVRVTIDPMP